MHGDHSGVRRESILSAEPSRQRGTLNESLRRGSGCCAGAQTGEMASRNLVESDAVVPDFARQQAFGFESALLCVICGFICTEFPIA